MSIKDNNPAILLLNRFKKRFDPAIKGYLEKELKASKKVDPRSTELLTEIIRMIDAGGKRFRPAAMYYTYRALGGSDKKKIMQACMSIELLHTFAVIHDDIIDKSDTRRGSPTVHKSLENKYKKLGMRDHKHLANSTALIVGDLAFTLSEKSLNDSGFSNDLIIKAQEVLSFTKSSTIFGEHLDMITGAQSDIPKQKVVEKILENKTAVYTFECPIALGAILAGATKTETKILKKVGNLLGKAFQIQDDILGVFADEKVLGKSVTSDLEEGKKTILISYAFKLANRAQKKILNRVLGKEGITIKMLNQVRDILRDTGSLNYSRNLAFKYIRRAKKLIKTTSLSPEGEEFLEGIADYLLVRDY